MTPGDEDRLAAWCRRPPDERRLHLADLRRGVELRRPRTINGPVVVPSRDAAVMLPVFEEGEGLQVVLIERSHEVGTHRGEVAFPGGHCEPGERGRDAAVRETEEETGIPAAAIDVVAALSTHPTWTGFVIWPYIGVLTGRPRLDRVSVEVARTFVIAVDDLVADGAWSQRPYGAGGPLLNYFTVPGNTAWGTTGDLVKELLEICILGRLGPVALKEDGP